MVRYAVGAVAILMAAGPAAAQVTGECANLANPPVSAPWSISSERGLPTALQFQQNPDIGANFSGVSGVSANDVWAVGGSLFDLNGPGTMFGTGAVYHFDGARWCRVTDQGPGDINELDGVAAISTDDVWAAGITITGGAGRTLIQHWDGKSWTTVPSPNPEQFLNELNSISAVSATDIWAVGFDQSSDGNLHALIAHYDGSAWTAVTPPPTKNKIAIAKLDRVFARTSSDVWAVGGQGRLGALGHVLIEHFDGTAWSIVPGANEPIGFTNLAGVTAIAANDVWAVGDNAFGDTRGFLNAKPVTEHWDGKTWTLVPAAKTGARSTMLIGVAARSANDVWAVGSTSTGALDGNGDVSSLVQHWDGTAWSVVASPNANAPGSARMGHKFATNTIGSGLNSLSIFPTGQLIAVGQYNVGVVNGTTHFAKPFPWSIERQLP